MAQLRETIGFIGSGNMARAIISGLIRAGMAVPGQIVASDAVPSQLERLVAECGVRTAPTNLGVVEAADIAIFCVKPFHMSDVCAEVAPAAEASKLFVSICAGIPTQFIEQRLGGRPRVVRVMPNTPSMIGRGAAGVAGGAYCTPEDVERVAALFRCVGVAVIVPENQMDLITGLTGSGPAYVYFLAEALIDAAVDLGMPAADAELLVRQLMDGAGRMAFESEKPLAELRAAVTTKGGTTEAGLRALEEGGFRALVRECVARATARSRELSKG
ncbi:MAG: pyrroline-5-carboxylate reductase [Candidatus Sumerlaeaceae bacterium]|nr:pyrroline-5-carboxylate reductase [Candidatus Sumerlaeaceae bacterium]